MCELLYILQRISVTSIILSNDVYDNIINIIRRTKFKSAQQQRDNNNIISIVRLLLRSLKFSIIDTWSFSFSFLFLFF